MMKLQAKSVKNVFGIFRAGINSCFYMIAFSVRFYKKLIFLFLVGTLVTKNHVSNAAVKLPSMFTSNMVLQCEEPIRIWGWADKKEHFDLVFNGTTTRVIADRRGHWQLELDPLPPGGPYNMLLYGQDTIELTNVLLGDVWICSGQSNMEWPMHQTKNAMEEIDRSTNPRIRLFTVEKKISTKPLEDCDAEGWQVCGPESVKNFSAVAYFFGRKLNEDLDRPIGLIHSSWGGTNVETWTSAKSIEKLEGFKGVSKELKEYDEGQMIARQREKLESVTGPLPDVDAGLINGKALWAMDSMDYTSWKGMDLPQLWETAGLTNLDGIVWYHKEFELDPADNLDNVEIHLGPIDDSDITYINGIEIGQTIQRYNESRIYNLPASTLKIGKNSLVIRVEDTGGGGGIHGEPEAMFVSLNGKKISLSGTWKYKVGKASFVSATSPNAMPALL
jgi:sialate O-acetylesterase